MVGSKHAADEGPGEPSRHPGPSMVRWIAGRGPAPGFPHSSSSSADSGEARRQEIRNLVREGREARERYSAVMREIDLLHSRLRETEASLVRSEEETVVAHGKTNAARAYAMGKYFHS